MSVLWSVLLSLTLLLLVALLFPVALKLPLVLTLLARRPGICNLRVKISNVEEN